MIAWTVPLVVRPWANDWHLWASVSSHVKLAYQPPSHRSAYPSWPGGSSFLVWLHLLGPRAPGARGGPPPGLQLPCVAQGRTGIDSNACLEPVPQEQDSASLGSPRQGRLPSAYTPSTSHVVFRPLGSLVLWGLQVPGSPPCPLSHAAFPEPASHPLLAASCTLRPACCPSRCL